MKQIVCSVLCGLLFLSLNAQSADDSLPPEVKELIGTEIRPTSYGHPGNPLGWEELWGSGIRGYETTDGDSLGFETEHKAKITILIVEKFHKDFSKTILDARVVPGSLLQYYTYKKEGGNVWKENPEEYYRINADCWRTDSEENETIIGMWRYRPKHLCEAEFSQVTKAWLMDKNGHLTDIPTKNVACRGENDCQD